MSSQAKGWTNYPNSSYVPSLVFVDAYNIIRLPERDGKVYD